MQHRPLGRSGLSTAPLVFGGNVFGWTAVQQLDELMAAARLELPGDVWKRLDDAGRL